MLVAMEEQQWRHGSKSYFRQARLQMQKLDERRRRSGLGLTMSDAVRDGSALMLRARRASDSTVSNSAGQRR
ncbi:hypothetical protein NL676_032748 [Syzygium grande]|nr:hypothetical protein NL676_032748 [Syzygium grande]